MKFHAKAVRLVAVVAITINLSGVAHAGGALLGDMNGDGAVDFFDIDRFVEILMSGGGGHVGPVGYYPFDGNCLDYGANRRSGSMVGEVVYDVGLLSQAATFDGEDDYVWVRAHPALSPPQFTWAAWFQMSTAPETDAAMTVMAQEADDFGIGSMWLGVVGTGETEEGAKLRFEWRVDDGEPLALVSTPTLLEGCCWYHAAVVYDGVSVSLYLDGELEGSLESPLTPAVADLGIAGHPLDPDTPFAGLIDEVRVYDRAVSETEVLDLATMLTVWGREEQGQLNGVPPGHIVDLGGGENHSAAIRCDGLIVTWGWDLWEQVSGKPGDTGYVVVDDGFAHSLALKEDGSLVAWGVHDGGTYDYGQVTDAPSGTGFVAISACGYHNLALHDPDGNGVGSIFAWGGNDCSMADSIPTDDDFTAIAAGFYHAVALRVDGSLEAWGCNDYGECNVPDGNDFVAIAAGFWCSMALRESGEIVVWGHDGYNQISGKPDGNDFVAIAIGVGQCLALRADGSLEAWGYNTDGQAEAPPGNYYTDIEAGGYHNLAR